MREWYGLIYTLPNVKSIVSGKQPYRTGRSALCFVTTKRGGIGKVGGTHKRERYGDICICVADSLCYKAETNTRLKSNYTPIKMLKIPHKTDKTEEIIKIWIEVNELEKRKSIEKFNETKYLFFENINKIEKRLTKLTRKNERRDKILKIKNESGDINSYHREIKRLRRDYYEQIEFVYQQIK